MRVIVDSDQKFENLLKRLSEVSLVTYDIETNSLNVRTNTIIGFGIAVNEDEAYYVPMYSYNKENDSIKPETGLSYAIQILNKLKNNKIICHNAYFDIESTKNFLCVDLLEQLHCDTMLLKHTVDENGFFGLKELAKKLYGEDSNKEKIEMLESIKSNGGTAKEYFKADLNIIAKYCMQDCILTYKIYNYYSTILKEKKLEKFFYEEEVMPLLQHVTFSLQNRGIPLNMDLLQKTHKELSDDLKLYESKVISGIPSFYIEKLNSHYATKLYPVSNKGNFAQGVAGAFNISFPKTATGKFQITKKTIDQQFFSPQVRFLAGITPLNDKDVIKVRNYLMKKDGINSFFNIQSKHHLKRLFFTYMGLEPISKTDKGNPQVDDKFLDKCAETMDWVKDLRTYNKLQKINSTYIERFLELQENGILYPAYHQHRTTSGRYGGDLMQLPRKLNDGSIIQKYTNVIRDLLIAGDGHKLVGADFNSLEAVVFADDSKDDSLLEMIRNGDDFYSTVAMRVYGMESDYSANPKSDNFFKKEQPDLRQESKAYSLGIRYGMGSWKLAHTLKIDETEADDIINQYFKSFPGLKVRMDEILNFAKENGYVKSKAGRIRHLPKLKYLHDKYGDKLLDSLWVYKKYSWKKDLYEHMKKQRKAYNAALNNALNFPIQSMAASIVNRASISLAKKFKELGLKSYLCLNVHDELVARCPEVEVETVSQLMQSTMEGETKLSVPLVAIPQIGDFYGEIK